MMSWMETGGSWQHGRNQNQRGYIDTTTNMNKFVGAQVGYIWNFASSGNIMNQISILVKSKEFGTCFTLSELWKTTYMCKLLRGRF